MPIFFTCFIVFAIWLRVKLRKADPAKDLESKQFWEREQQANFARTRDISNLDYLTVPQNILPFSNSESLADERELDLEEQVRDAAGRKMLNLSAFSNTDLKEQYGIANLEELSNCDQNYLIFIRRLANWGTYLYEKGDFTRARQIMEYSLSIKSDISAVYTTLGHIYARQDETAKIDALITTVEHSDFALKKSILKQLSLCKLDS